LLVPFSKLAKFQGFAAANPLAQQQGILDWFKAVPRNIDLAIGRDPE
jgi:hypothetical protein